MLKRASADNRRRYYFYNEGASIATVLKDANLVDITQVRGQVEDSKTKVVQGLTGSFTWRYGYSGRLWLM